MLRWPHHQKRQEKLLPHLQVFLHIFLQILLESSFIVSFRKYRIEFLVTFLLEPS